tara:strand:- start:427 stop:1299 length:873 start_codon:yes stop_codon:yes gene_type:complete
MSHSGITPLTEQQKLVSGKQLLPSGEASFFDFRQHTSSDWDSTTPTEDVYYSASGDYRATNPNYIITNSQVRHKEFDLGNNKKYIVASGINFPFPNPYNASYPENITGEMFSIAWWEASGIYKTYPPAAFLLIDQERQSGILHWEGFKQVEGFSNSPDVAPLIPEVKFNNYIHYFPEYPNHMHNPPSKLEVPDYSDPDVTLEKLRREQKRKYIQIEYLSDVTKRTRPSDNNNQNYEYDDDGLFSSVKSEVPFMEGMCEYTDGTCRDNISEEACTAYPGAIWTSGESCPEE